MQSMVCALLLAASAAFAAEAPEAAASGAAQPERSASACDRAVPFPWPATASQRRAHLSRMETMRPRCMEHAGFLASLGGLLLEDGDAEQALTWLERSLLLDPGDLGAQADHALALAALGEPRALQQLAAAWAARPDIPPALRARLYPPVNGVSAVRLGRSGLPIWGVQREVSLMAGYESNLDQSPRLTELTLTAPDGNLVLPVTSQPRRGAAMLASAALQGAYSPGPGAIWRTGLTLAARATPAEPGTDWQYLQWGANGVHQWAWWRTHLELGASWFTGPLNEPYRLLRTGVAADAAAWSCRVRLGVDVEQRKQSSTTTFDAGTTGLQIGAQCPMTTLPGGTWSVVVRGAEDRPDDELRPGGVQRQNTIGARLSAPMGPQWRLDLGVRFSTVRDALGYSPLLENNAPRRLRQKYLTLELLYRPDAPWMAGAETVIQLHLARQDSNLALFEYRAASLYSGLRWIW